MISQPLYSSLPQGPTCKKIQNYIFKFSDLLGQGNFSKVYKAHHQITDQVVAIKIVELNSLKSKKLEQLLFSEINVLKKLNHPNILRCFEVFTSNRNCYIITELCNEGDLESKLRRRNNFSEQAAQSIIRDIFQGMLYLAGQNVIHRDLKVANVFMHNGKAKIADFGFAKFTKTKFKDINIGSPIYMSPQGFIENIYGPKTDTWAFGVLIYQLLHGQTPFNSCKSQSQLKYNLSLPLNRNKIKQEISYELQQVIMKCMQIDEQKRMTAFQLAKLPYFERILRNTNATSLSMDTFANSNTSQYKVRSPSYQNREFLGNKNSNTLSYQQNAFQNRRVSLDRNPRENNLLTVQSVMQQHGHSPLNGFRNENAKVNEARTVNFFSTRNFDTIAHEKIGENSNIEQRKQRQRGITTEKRYLVHANHQTSPTVKSIQKRQGLHLVSNARLPKAVSGKLTFKQTVNLLHYGRMVFKHITLLRDQQNWQSYHQQQVYTLTKWLFIILDQVAQKIENKQISFQGGTNSEVRQKKLIQVTSQYQKKYRKQLQNQLIEINRKDKNSNFTIDHIKTFLYNRYIAYDKLIYTNEMNKNLIWLGHNIMMIYQATRLLKKCYDEKNYYLLQNYKDIESFLSRTKDSMDLQSYQQRRKGMSIYG